jgi:hypothetical protein
MKPDGSYKCAYPALSRIGLVFDAVLGKILVIDNHWLGNVAVS